MILKHDQPHAADQIKQMVALFSLFLTIHSVLVQVLDLIRPSHRLVVFLQQSSVEWASSLWLPVIQEVDPHLNRSVVVVSKLDNRMREFEERWELDKWLAADGVLGKADVRPFYIALPKDRHFESNAHFR